MSTFIEPLDLFGLGCLWWRDQPGRECLQDQARYDAVDRSKVVVQLAAPGCPYSRLEIEVAQDAAGRWWAGHWWAGHMWRCWHVPDGVCSGSATPIDAYRGATRALAIQAAAQHLVRRMPDGLPGKAGRIFAHWRRELAKHEGGMEA